MIRCGDADVDPREALAELVRLGYRRILLEGGPALLDDAVAVGVVDELALTLSPLMVGGRDDDGTPFPRIVTGRPIHGGRFTLEHIMEDDGALFQRYLRVPPLH